MTATKALAKTGGKAVKARKAKVGRPTNYKPAYCSQVIDHLSQGYSLTTFAANVGTNPQTLYSWSDANQEFSDAIAQGRAVGQKLWEDRLGVQVVTGKGNSSALVFGMKNLYPWDWREKQEIDHRHSGSIAVETDGRQLGRAVIEILAQGRTIPGVSQDITDITPDGETVDTDE